MSQQNPVQDNEDNLKDLLQSIAWVRDKVVAGILSEEDFLKQMNAASMAVGVVYEGMRAINDQDAQQRGLSSEMVFSVLTKVSSAAIPITTETGVRTLRAHLDDLRRAIRNKTAATGHKWRFQVEAQVEAKAGSVLWLQRWSTAVNV